jgi:membrane protein DedA with SNARE-associated domain
LGLFVVLAVGVVALPVPEDTVLIFAGCLVYRQKFALLPTWLAAFSGCITGITLSYLLGRSIGFVLLTRKGHLSGYISDRVERAEAWFHRVGKWGLLLGYFVPGVRHFIAIAAGASRLRFPVFALFAWSGAMFWSTSFLMLGYLVGEEWKQLEQHMRKPQFAVLIAVAVAAVACSLLRRRKAMGCSRDSEKTKHV